MDKAYSTNDEDFCFTDPQEALEELWDIEELHEGAIYYEMDCERVNMAKYLRVDTLIENAEEAAYDDLGERAEDCFDVGADAIKELELLIQLWVDKHFARKVYWRGVGGSREVKVTAEDVAQFAGR